MNDKENFDFSDAAIIIKDAIVRSRYQAAALVNKELLGLYYAVGRYVSINSRSSVWGQGAIKRLSESLQKELPGLRGFSESAIKRMRNFYEDWQPVFTNRPLSMGDLVLAPNRAIEQTESNLAVAVSHHHSGELVIDLNLLSRHLNSFTISGFSSGIYPDFSVDTFLRVGFTQHSEILAKEKTLGGRLFYITRCAAEFWSVEALKSNLRGDLYAKSGALPNNFLQALPERELARRAVRAFKDEYLLDFINIDDENDPDERLIEHGIIANIK